MRKNNCLLIGVWIIFNAIYCSTLNAEEIQRYYYVELQAFSAAERAEIANYIHIDQIGKESISAVVNHFDAELLKTRFPYAIVATKQLAQFKDAPHNAENVFPEGDELYHTYEEVVDKLAALHREYPQLTSLFSMGKTVEGLDIVGIRISAAESRSSAKELPGIFFVGAHHAREHLSTEVPLKLIEHLLLNAENDEHIAKLIQSREIYIVPMLNVDGAMHDIKGGRYKFWRKNRIENHDGSFGVDLNRNYAYGWGTGGSSRSPSSDVYMGPSAFSEPESRAVKTFIEKHSNITVALSFHTYSELILYPWGGKNDGVGGRDEQVFSTMANTMAAWNGYTPEQASDLYIASGDTCDWAYGEYGIFCFTFELSPKQSFFGQGFYPGPEVIDTVFKANLKPALYLIDAADDPYKVLR